MSILVKVQTEDFNLQEEYQALLSLNHHVGAVVSFIGLVRDRDTDVQLTNLYLEHFPGVTEAEIERIAQIAMNRWPISACTIVHRVGELAANEQIVLVLTASEHRRAAFEAAEYLMDYLKVEAPFWKREVFSDGHEHWVEARQSDKLAADKWDSQS